MNKTRRLMTIMMALALGLAGCSSQAEPDPNAASAKKLSTLQAKNRSLQSSISKQRKQNKADAASIAKRESTVKRDEAASAKDTPAAPAPKAKPSGTTTAQLAAMSYTGTQEIAVNGNQPSFSQAELSTAKGAWEAYADLDNQNRAVNANALLSQALMPTAKREGLTWNPTGWHNKRTAHGWLYNRSHLIGFQLSGENNNPRNLITGTMSLNNPGMLAHEMDIATYLKSDAKRYVRYRVTPVYRGNELVARGVQMMAQSIGDNAIHFNVYIFNVEPGYNIDYATGYSTTK